MQISHIMVVGSFCIFIVTNVFTKHLCALTYLRRILISQISFINEMSAKSTSRHYTHVEKEIFLDLLNEFKDVIENKKSDSAALKHKEYAWKQIEEAYNGCHLVSQRRSTAQLKKWWSNMKQQQRTAKTKERQQHVGPNSTGLNSAVEQGQIDPRVVALHLSAPVTAPTLFSSNMTDEELETKERSVRGPEVESFLTSSNHTTNNATTEPTESPTVGQEMTDDLDLSNASNFDAFKSQTSTPATSIYTDNGILRRLRKRKRSSSSSSSGTDLQAERLKISLKYADELHKLELASLVEELNDRRAHLKKMHELEEISTRKKLELEERTALAKTQLAELDLERAIARHS